MGAGRRRRIRLKSKRRPQRPGKDQNASPCALTDDDDISQLESTHSLLLSSLRYWEVERDLIDERIAALRALTVPS